MKRDEEGRKERARRDEEGEKEGARIVAYKLKLEVERLRLEEQERKERRQNEFDILNWKREIKVASGEHENSS